jgi:membrane-bound lytic murein transglycosylase D
LRDLYAAFGDWYLAIAAYNCGPGAVAKAVERTGYADFWELRNRGALPIETTNYVPIILAMTIMAKNAPEYGLEGLMPDAPIEYDNVDITAPTRLNLVADLTDEPVSELMALNPALLRGVAPAGYSLHVPRGTGGSLRASLEMVPADKRLSWRMHKVAEGETLASIGKRYGTSAALIANANKLLTNDPVAGDRLAIPAIYKEPVAGSATTASATRHTAVTRRPVLNSNSARHTTGAARPAAGQSATPAGQSSPLPRKSAKSVAHTAYNRNPIAR